MSDIRLSEQIRERLAALGFDGVSQYIIEYAADKAENTIKTAINRDAIPDSLKIVLLDMAVGHALNDTKNFGMIDESKLNLSDIPIKSVSEGDISVTFSGASDGSLTPEARFDKMVDGMINPDPGVFAAYRRLKW